MAGRDERLPPATRNYVIFGLLLILALALAARDHYGPHQGSGESDSALRLMIVGGSAATANGLDEVDGFSVLRLELDEALTLGRELVDEDAPAYAALIAYADQRGYGFLVLDLDSRIAGEETEPTDWGFDEDQDEDEADIGPLPPASVRFVVFSVGDLAPEGPRIHWFELAPFEYDSPLAEFDGIRLALYDHPDLLALWEGELAATQLQAQQVLTNRGLRSRRDVLHADQARWRELSELWPTPGAISGSLASPWQQVQAAPVRGGVLLELREARVHVDVYRRTRLELDDTSGLWFVPLAELGDSDPSSVRQRCEGLPSSVSAELSVAPDGDSLILKRTPTSLAHLFVFDEQAAREGRCKARLVNTLVLGARSLGQPNVAGRMISSKGEDRLLHWWSGQGVEQSARIWGIDNYSGPWWVDEELVAMVAEHPRQGPSHGVLVLFDVGDELEALSPNNPSRRLDLDAAELFSEPAYEPEAKGSAALLDLRPAGPNELLLLTERCPRPRGGDQPDASEPRPCLHRLRSDAPLIELLRSPATKPDEADLDTPDQPAYTVETLGPLGPYLALAIAAEGGRAVWIRAAADSEAEGETQLMSADLRGPARVAPRRLDDDALADSNPRISADGRVVLSEVAIDLGELGTLSVARAFVLDPAPATPAAATVTDRPAAPTSTKVEP